MVEQGTVVPAVILLTWENEEGGLKVQGQPGQFNETLSENKKYKGLGRSSAVECLPRMCETPCFTPVTNTYMHTKE